MNSKAPGNHERVGISIFELFQMFPDELSARKWLENIRWEDERHCPHCGSVRTFAIPKEKPMPYHCRDCKQYFSVRTNTVMQSSRLPLQKWVIAMYLMLTDLKGVSSMKLHRDLGITQKSAWLLSQKIRQGFINDGEIKISGSIEVDETYIGGLEKNKHASKRLRKGRGAVGKTAVVGAKQRDGMI